MAMNVSQFVSSDNFNMAEFNDMITQINSGVNSEVTSLTTLINGCAKIQTGSYTGTGTYGVSNPCSLTFNFTPTFFSIYGFSKTTEGDNFICPMPNIWFWRDGATMSAFSYWNPSSSSNTYITLSFTFNGGTVSWVGATGGDYQQLNHSTWRYYYVAFQ